MKIRIERKKPRNAVARDLFSPKYRQRVVPNKKHASKSGTKLSKNEAKYLTEMTGYYGA